MAGLDGAEDSVIDEVSEWLDVDPERLMLFQQARALESDTGLPAPLFYALGRSGTGPALEELLDVPMHELRTTVEEAVADGIVDAEPLGDLDSLVERLAHQVVDHATRADLAPPRYWAGRDPCGCGHSLGHHRAGPAEVPGALQDASEFWESFGETAEAESVDDDTARDIQVGRPARRGARPGSGAAAPVHALRREGRWQAPEDLSRFSFDDWCDLLEDARDVGAVAGTLDRDAAPTAAEDDTQERIEARAEAILDTLEETLPERLHSPTAVRSDRS